MGMSNQASFTRRWAIPMAATIPLCAVVFAFSLGPSPRKVVDDYLHTEGPAKVRLAQLDRAGKGVVSALAERVHETNLPHRTEVIAYLGRAADHRALGALERVCNSPVESVDIRKQAFEAALAIDRRRGLALAEGLQDAPAALGEAARRALATQERTELTPR